MGVNDKLKQARKNAKMTQKYVEDKTGIKVTTLSNWENGVSSPDVEKIKILCSLYDVKPNEIFEWGSQLLVKESIDEYGIQTLAAHHDDEEWSEEEKKELDQFKSFLRSKRQS